MFEIIFYETNSEKCPVEEFLDDLETKMNAKMIGILEILQEKGNALRDPYTKHLDDGIFEVRAKVGSDISRVMFFFVHGKRIILTNGFIKKTKKTPTSEIVLAKKYRDDYLERLGKDENFK